MFSISGHELSILALVRSLGLGWVDCHASRHQLLHEDLERRHPRVLGSLFRGIKVAQLGHRSDVHIVSEVGEHRGRDAPLSSVDSLSLKLLGTFSESLFSCLGVDNLVEASKHISTSDVLERCSGLDEEAPLRNLDSSLCPVASPDEEARVARLTVNGHEADVVVEACEDCSNIVLYKIRTCRCKQVRTTLHSVSEGILFDAHANSGHLCYGQDCLVEFATPVVHGSLPIRVSLGDDIWEVVIGPFRALTNLVHKAPLGIINRLQR